MLFQPEYRTVPKGQWRHDDASMAWIIATDADDALRNGPEALELLNGIPAQRFADDPWLLDTRAAVYAELGRFDEAVQMQQRAVQAVRTKLKKPRLQARMERRLRLYESSTAFRGSRGEEGGAPN